MTERDDMPDNRTARGPSTASIGAWAALMRAGQGTLAAVEADLKAAGLPPLSWYDLLLELSRAEGGVLRPQTLEKRMLLAQYSVSRLADRLAGEGYLERRPCPEDGRGCVLALTEAGRRLLKEMWPPYAAAIQAHLGSRLSPAEAVELARLLGKLGKLDAGRDDGEASP